MKAWPPFCAFRLAKVIVMAAALLLPRSARARSREEWMAELDEYRRESIAPIPPALRMLSTAPATRHGLRSADRILGWTMRYRLFIALLPAMPALAAGIPRRLGDRLFAMNDTEAYWRGWQITRTHGGAVRRYRDPRFDTIDPMAKHNQPAA